MTRAHDQMVAPQVGKTKVVMVARDVVSEKTKTRKEIDPMAKN